MSSDALQSALKVAASGLSAQSTRLRIVSENIANAQSTGKTGAPCLESKAAIAGLNQTGVSQALTGPPAALEGTP